MSKRRTHRAIGTLAGGGYALAKAKQQPPEHLLVEVLGGLAGNLGAHHPNVVDPPLPPGHRSLAHRIVPVAAIGKAAVNALGGWQAQLRAEANRRAAPRASAATLLERFWHALLDLPCRFGAGALAGYGSHVALDAFTPTSLPLLA